MSREYPGRMKKIKILPVISINNGCNSFLSAFQPVKKFEPLAFACYNIQVIIGFGTVNGLVSYEDSWKK